MKLTLEAIDLEEAIKLYLKNTYSLYGEVIVQHLNDVEVIIKPRDFSSSIRTSTGFTSSAVAGVDYKDTSESEDTTLDYDTTREDAIGRADHLGIKYRADISTEKLIERIEEHEEEVLRLATEERENFPEEPMNDGNELPLENDVDTVVESDEPVEELSDETIQEVQEEQPQKKKKSIFDKSE